MAVKTTIAGKMDKRTKEYKDLKERLAKARAAKASSGATKKTTTKLKKTASGKVDKRTKEGKEIAARMAKARKAKNSLANRIKRLFS